MKLGGGYVRCDGRSCVVMYQVAVPPESGPDEFRERLPPRWSAFGESMLCPECASARVHAAMVREASAKRRMVVAGWLDEARRQ